MEPYIYSIVDKTTLENALTSFQICNELPVQIIDDTGNIIFSTGETTCFCQEFKKFLPRDDSCEKMHVNASKKAITLGETYIFICHADLTHMIFPLMYKSKFIGSVLVGPFLMEKPDSTIILDIAKRYSIPLASLMDLNDLLTTIKIIPPSKVTHISRLLSYVVGNLLLASREDFLISQGKLYQQSKINEAIQMYKNSDEPVKSNYPFDKEKALIAKVKQGDLESAKAILNDLFGYVFFSEGSSLDIIKSRSIELSSLLSRAAIEGGGRTDEILKINNEFLKSLSSITTLEELCFKMQETVETFTDTLFMHVPKPNSEIIKKAAAYISKNYSACITLEDVAREVHLNPTYFSTLFKQITGSSFKEHLNMVRIEESKRLLLNTNYSLINIAIATGFENQSYFTKVFKKYTGLTPKQYRQ